MRRNSCRSVIRTSGEVDDGYPGSQIDAQIAVPGIAFFFSAIGLGLAFLDLVAHAGIEQRTEFSEWSHVDQRT